MSGGPSGFEFVRRGDDVVITHHGRRAAVLRGHRAARFLEEVQSGDAQLLMARLTGHYKHGNERDAQQSRRRR